MSGFRTVTSGWARDAGLAEGHCFYQGVEKMIVIRLLDFAQRHGVYAR